MVVDSYVERARTRVEEERRAVEAKLDAFEAFVRRVENVSTEATSTPSAGVTALSGTHQRVSSTADTRCRQVRTAFAETVRPHSVGNDGEPLLETIRAELTEPIAVALAPTTDTSFTPELERTILAGATRRRAEVSALDRALDREASRLDDAGEVVDEVTGWIVDANETPLTALGFDALRRRHETLADHRSRCETLARRRQAFLDRTTSNGPEAGIHHRQLVSYLYEELPVEHPVLATAASLESICEDCQRTVRDHLTRRG